MSTEKKIAWVVIVILLHCQVRCAWAISISEERKMAKEFMEAISMQNKLVKDPMAVALVSEVGRRIVAQLPPQPFPFSFYIVDNGQFNAFATPGGNIFVHRGLITSLDNVDELAGILGHESAHAACRHVSQMIDRSKVVNMGTLAGVLAGVLVGAAGGADAGQAVAMGAMAVGQTSMLAYSRENETEADQKGILLTQAASFDPRGLLTGLEKIRSRDWYGSEKIPGYLKTHPGSADRIVYISSWLDQHGDETEPDNGIDPFRFDLVKHRLAGLYGAVDETEQEFNHLLEKNPNDPAVHYGMGVLLPRVSRLDEALVHLRRALSQKIFDPYILLETGHVYLLAGDGKKAFDLMAGLEKIPAIATQATYYQAWALWMMGKGDKAERGLLKTIQTAGDVFPKSYYFMADVARQRQQTDQTHYYLGRYYYEISAFKNAVFHLKKSIALLPDGEMKTGAREMIGQMEKQKKKKRG
ncbi:Putative Zn-dependent protease, contains TPR repeats [Desulfocicer vacuolatum DSM 3385]|uniref:Putative Zn-dependent protease, contains TPR repeats n=1 Tax=Desulfocicer vacuolatum DSM 3385 TaxID=1121400 RepID=A0A1W1ZS46_9BACT|nr:M48 family metallopeptidase [Desulfocicer vacuolatum]SMC51032.1 Putative Zn-dependent protease, contains TPR repeats [Desulfocicer vacuolatum DSM 3385]